MFNQIKNQIHISKFYQERKSMSEFHKLTRRSFTKGIVGTALFPFLSTLASRLIAEDSFIDVPPAAIAYLMADEARRPATLTEKLTEKMESGVPGIKRWWVENWKDPAQVFEWKVRAEHAGKYEATIMISAPPGSPVVIEGPRGQLNLATSEPEFNYYGPNFRGYYWDRITLPTPLSLPKGESTIRVHLLKPVTEGSFGAALKSIELLNVEARPAVNERLRKFRSNASWLTDAKFGFMCQCGEWSYPPHGPHKPWPEMVDKFDVEKFAELVDSTGAGYAIWSATWSTYFFPAPIRTIDDIMPGRTSKRDLIGEMAEALAKRDIRLMLYYHLGQSTSPQNGTWWSKNWVSAGDKSLFVRNWCSILKEVGERYGDKLAGWMFDDEEICYPMPYEIVGKSAKAGNSSRIISYNSWIQARGTDFQDFQFGDGFHGNEALPESAHGIWPSGPMKGLQAHGDFQLDGPNWGINRPDEIITKPFFSAKEATDLALVAAKHNFALSWNLEMYDDGSVSEESLKVFQQAGSAVRKLYPRKKISGS